MNVRLGERSIVVYCPKNGPKLQPSLGADDIIPAGPYRIGMTWAPKVGRNYELDPSKGYWSEPYILLARNGKCVAGHIPSLAIAVHLRDALNARRKSRHPPLRLVSSRVVPG